MASPLLYRRDIANRDTGAVLKKDAARIVFLEGQIFDRHVADLLPVDQSEQRGRGCVAFNPRILAQAAVKLKVIPATSKERSANYILESVSRPRSKQAHAVATPNPSEQDNVIS